MHRIFELKRRERRLRAKIRLAAVGEYRASPEDRSWIVHHLAEMRMIVDRHLAELPSSERQYEEYRLEFELPMFTYLSRAYLLFYPHEPGFHPHDPGVRLEGVDNLRRRRPQSS